MELRLVHFAVVEVYHMAKRNVLDQLYDTTQSNFSMVEVYHLTKRNTLDLYYNTRQSNFSGCMS